MKQPSKSKDARRRARKLVKRTLIKTSTKVIPDKRKKPARTMFYFPWFEDPYTQG
jgi:hypothetical protein